MVDLFFLLVRVGMVLVFKGGFVSLDGIGFDGWVEF